MVSVLAIAGSDPSGGAGIEVDLRTFAQLGVHGRTAITALTVQSLHHGVAVHSTAASILSAILHSHTRDYLPDAIKIGMIGTGENLQAIAAFLNDHPHIPVVLDTVLRATSGLELLETAAIPFLRDQLVPRATVVTPNLQEASILTGMTVNSLATMEHAARELHRGTQVVLVKGGHLSGEPIDVAFDGREIHHFSSPRIATSHTRGTGCTLASAIAAYLAQGAAPLVAIQKAKIYLRNYLSTRL